MASGRKNRGSRHRSHRHKQRRGDESGDSDAEQNLRHGPNPHPDVSFLTMEPLPPDAAGPSVPGLENVEERDFHHHEQKGLQGLATAKQSSLGDSASMMNLWDGADGCDENTSSAFRHIAESNFSTDSQVKGRVTPAMSSSKGGSIIDANLTLIGKNQLPDTAQVSTTRKLAKDRELDDSSLQVINSSAESKRKHARKSDPSQKSRRLESWTSPCAVDSRVEDNSGAPQKGQGDTRLVENVVRNIELEKEFENPIRCHQEGSGSRERWSVEQSKGSCYENEEHEEKARHVKLIDDGDCKDGRDSVSRNRDKRWKVSRPLEDQHAKDESLNVSDGCEGRGKHEKDYERRKNPDRRRGERSLETTAQDDRQEKTMGNEEELKSGRNKDVLRNAKERDGKTLEVKHTETRLQDKKSRDIKSNTEANTAEDTLFSSDKAEEEKPKPKDRDGKLEKNLRDEKEKVGKHREEEAGYVNNKHDKRRGEPAVEDCPKHKDGLGPADGGADNKGRKRSDREHDHNPKDSKRKTEEGGIQKQQDCKDMIDRLKRKCRMENRWDNAKQANDADRHEKLLEGTEKEGDAWVSGERGSFERTKEAANRHSQRMNNEERRWGGGLKHEMGDYKKDIYNPQKHGRDSDERTRYGAGKHRGDQGKDGRKQHDKAKDDIHRLALVFERSRGSKESRQKANMGNKESKYGTCDKSNHNEGVKNSRDMDGQPKSKGTFEPTDVRESKGQDMSKTRRTGLKASTSMAYHTSTQNLVAKDFSRSSGRLVDDSGRLPHKDKPFHEKSAQKDMLEISASLSSSGGTRQPRDQNWPLAGQGKHYLGYYEEEVKTWEPKIPNQELDDERRRPFSHERTRDSLSPRGLFIGGDSMPSRDASMPKRKHDNFSQGAGGPMKRMWGDDTSGERSSCGNRPSTDGPVGRLIPPIHDLGPPGLLPPPPPYRPGIDNPTVMGVPKDFVEGSNSRESMWYDRKARGSYSKGLEMVGPGDAWIGFDMSHWNAHNQGPVPGPASIFSSFPGMGLGYLGFGQEFHVPQVFSSNGSRPPVNMGYGGRFHMGGDGGTDYFGHPSDHRLGMGWHKYSDWTEGHHHMHAWEGPGRYPDERQSFGHLERDEFFHGFVASEPWQGQPGDVNHESHSQREALYPGKLGEGPQPNSEVENSQAVEYKKPETPEVRPVLQDLKAESHTGKRKERKQMVLLHVDVCVKLVDSDLYKEYVSSLPSPQAKKKTEGSPQRDILSAPYVDNDLEFEVDAEAQDLLTRSAPSLSVLPRLTENAHQDVFKLFRRQLQQSRVQKLDVGSFLLHGSIISWPSVSTSCSSRGMDVRSASPNRLKLINDCPMHAIL